MRIGAGGPQRAPAPTQREPGPDTDSPDTETRRAAQRVLGSHTESARAPPDTESAGPTDTQRWPTQRAPGERRGVVL